MAISSDGQALYVVNYVSNTVSVLKASDLSIVHTFPVPDHPIGIAYEPVHHRVWVACYSGEILVYDGLSARRGTPRRAATAGNRPRG